MRSDEWKHNSCFALVCAVVLSAQCEGIALNPVLSQGNRSVLVTVRSALTAHTETSSGRRALVRKKLEVVAQLLLPQAVRCQAEIVRAVFSTAESRQCNAGTASDTVSVGQMDVNLLGPVPEGVIRSAWLGEESGLPD